MFLDYPIAEAQTKPGSLSHLLGRKEWIKNFGQIFFGNPWAIVLKSDAHDLATHFSRDLDRAFGLVPLDGLARVVNDIKKDLLDLMRIHHRFWHIRIELRRHFDIARAQLVLQKFNRALHQLIDARKLALGRAVPGETQQALHDLMAALGALV